MSNAKNYLLTKIAGWRENGLPSLGQLHAKHVDDLAKVIEDYRGETSILSEDQGYWKMDLTECCKIGPISKENYCPECGKKIIRAV